MKQFSAKSILFILPVTVALSSHGESRNTSAVQQPTTPGKQAIVTSTNTPVADTTAPLMGGAQGFDPSDATTNVKYELKDNNKYIEISIQENGTKTPVAREITAGSELDKDFATNHVITTTYKIYTLDGKTLIATYKTKTDLSTITMVTAADNKTITFDLTATLKNMYSAFQDNQKRTYPVYWLYKKGLLK